jgi:hypothetical protein
MVQTSPYIIAFNNQFAKIYQWDVGVGVGPELATISQASDGFWSGDGDWLLLIVRSGSTDSGQIFPFAGGSVGARTGFYGGLEFIPYHSNNYHYIGGGDITLSQIDLTTGTFSDNFVDPPASFPFVNPSDQFGPTLPVTCINWNTANDRIAFVIANTTSWYSQPVTVYAWDDTTKYGSLVGSPAGLQALTAPQYYNSIEWAPDDAHVAITSTKGIAFYNWTGGSWGTAIRSTFLLPSGYTDVPTRFKWTPDKNYVTIQSGSTYRTWGWSWTTGTYLAEVTYPNPLPSFPHGGPVWSPDMNWVAFSFGNAIPVVYEFVGGAFGAEQPHPTIVYSIGAPYSLSWHPLITTVPPTIDITAPAVVTITGQTPDVSPSNTADIAGPAIVTIIGQEIAADGSGFVLAGNSYLIPAQNEIILVERGNAIISSDAEPVGVPIEGALWLNTLTGAEQLYQWTGAAWVPAAGVSDSRKWEGYNVTPVDAAAQSLTLMTANGFAISPKRGLEIDWVAEFSSTVSVAGRWMTVGLVLNNTVVADASSGSITTLPFSLGSQLAAYTLQSVTSATTFRAAGKVYIPRRDSIAIDQNGWGISHFAVDGLANPGGSGREQTLRSGALLGAGLDFPAGVITSVSIQLLVGSLGSGTQSGKITSLNVCSVYEGS